MRRRGVQGRTSTCQVVVAFELLVPQVHGILEGLLVKGVAPCFASAPLEALASEHSPRAFHEGLEGARSLAYVVVGMPPEAQKPGVFFPFACADGCSLSEGFVRSFVRSFVGRN